MAEWDGKDRRNYSDLREVVRDELMPIKEQQAEMRRAQIIIEKKIGEWESGARWFRVFIIGTVSLVTAAAAAYEWLKDHIK